LSEDNFVFSDLLNSFCDCS